MEETIRALILAAGMSRRMEEFKPLMPFRGRTVIENSVESALSGGAETALVVIGFRGNEIEAVLAREYGDRVLCVYNPDFALMDMLQSVKVGISAMPPCDAFFLLPGDMPVITSSTFELLRSVRNGARPAVVFPTLGGHRKHPPLIDGRKIPAILAFCGNGGLRELWKEWSSGIVDVPVDDPGVGMDMDTIEDYKIIKERYSPDR